MQPLCVIPARAGSKRLDRKNVLPLAGRPMLAYTIEAARDSKLFAAVYVSTEDESIAALARDHGATVPGLRPAALAGDTVTNVEVCLHLADQLAAAGGAHDAVVCLQPSSPLRGAAHVRAAWEAFDRQGADFLVSVAPVDPHCYHWAMEERDGSWRMVFGDRYLAVRQDLPPVFRPNGAIKIARLKALRATGHFFGERLAAYPMPEDASVHVATAIDLKLCEALLDR